MEEKYEIFIQNSRIILRHGCNLRFFGARYHPVGDSSPLLDNNSCCIARSLVRGVPIPNEVSRGLVPRESLGDLARDPLRSRVFRHAKRQPNSSSMPYDDKTIKHPERDRWKDKKVDRRDAVGTVAQKRAPALRWWACVAGHISSDCRLSDLEAELEQFTMNVWGAPERVRPAHLANERAQLSRDLRSANRVARSPV